MTQGRAACCAHTMSANASSSARWRIAAEPAELLSLSASFAHCADAIEGAARRCASSAYVSPVGVDGLTRATLAIGDRLRDVGRALDAADLSTRLRRLSVTLQASMRSRGLRFPSAQARLLGSDPARSFLRVDAHGHGAVVEIFGDLRTAEHVAILIPGMTNSLLDYDDNLRAKGRDLAVAMRTQQPNTVVVAWLGYRTPDLSLSGLVDGATSDRARTGARALVSDLEVIRRMAPHSHLTVLGHSYGSVVVGETMKSRKLRERVTALGIEDVAVVGSPGMNVSSRWFLRHPEIDVWASKASGIELGHVSVKVRTDAKQIIPWLLPPSRHIRRKSPVEASVEITPPLVRDAVPFAPVHGEDPSAKGFGANRFSSSGTRSHGDYFRPGTLSLLNLARIATNRAPVKQLPKEKTPNEAKQPAAADDPKK